MKYRHRVLGLVSLLLVITYLDRVCISVAWGWITGIFTISYAAFEIPSGVLGDRIGPRRVLTRIVLWWSAFTSLTGVVSDYYALLVTRILFGAGEAGAYPLIQMHPLWWLVGFPCRNAAALSTPVENSPKFRLKIPSPRRVVGEQEPVWTGNSSALPGLSFNVRNVHVTSLRISQVNC